MPKWLFDWIFSFSFGFFFSFGNIVGVVDGARERGNRNHRNGMDRDVTFRRIWERSVYAGSHDGVHEAAKTRQFAREVRRHLARGGEFFHGHNVTNDIVSERFAARERRMDDGRVFVRQENDGFGLQISRSRDSFEDD